MPRKKTEPDLFLALSTMPPDALAELCARIQQEKPRTAAIMADVLRPTGPMNAYSFVNPNPPATNGAAPIPTPKSSALRQISRTEAEILPPEFLADREP